MVRLSETFMTQITKLAKDGAQQVDGYNASITNITDPQNPQDVATKNYVDSNSGSNTTKHQEVFTATPNQTAFTLAHTPINQQYTELFITGLSQIVGIDFTVTGNVLTYSGAPALLGGEEVVIAYFETVSIPTGNTGPTGPTGAGGVGPTGPTGIGSTGPTGLAGPQNITLLTGVNQTYLTNQSIGSFVLDAYEYTNTGLNTFTFQAILACTTSGETASLALYNLTDGLLVTTLSTTAQVQTLMSVTLTSPTNLPGSQKLYNLQLTGIGSSITYPVLCTFCGFKIST